MPPTGQPRELDVHDDLPLLGQVFDASPVAMAITDLHGRYVRANAAHAELIGYSVGDHGSLDLGATARAEDQAWTASYVRRLRSGELPTFSSQKQVVRRDGSEVCVLAQLSALHGADGRPTAILEALTPSDAAPPVDDARVRRFLERSATVLTVTDRNGRIIETTGRYSATLGYPVEFWVDRTVFDLLDPDDVDRAVAFRSRLLATPGGECLQEFRIRAADGTTQIVEVHAVNLLDDPDVAGVVMTTQNVTHVHEQIAELRAGQATAQAVADARANLLATVSHELRNPLHALLGTAELLTDEPLAAGAAALAETLHVQLATLTAVTEDLLDTAQLDAGSAQLRIAPCDIRALIAEAVELGKASVQDGAVEVVAMCDPSLPGCVAADASRLRQMLRNLVGNAVKFTPAGQVRVTAGASGDGIVIVVSDDGVGIPADELAAVLQPFRTASTAGDRRGAGLGLAIVQRLAAAMAGTLDVSSTVGAGTTFRLTLPLPTCAAPAPGPAPVDDTAATLDLTVLVVEDNAVNRRIAASQLERLGMVAVLVESGEAALELMAGDDAPHIDVVLMDQQLPGIDGLETTRRLRTLHPHLAGVPVIGLTASASAAERERYLAAGVDGFVAKPASLADIRFAIHEVCRTRVGAAVASIDGNVDGDVDGAVRTTTLAQLVAEFDDEAVVDELVVAYLQELPSRRDDLLAAVATGNDEAMRLAHTLKGTSLMLGAQALGELCAAIERGERPQVDTLASTIDTTAAGMQQWLARAGRAVA